MKSIEMTETKIIASRPHIISGEKAVKPSENVYAAHTDETTAATTPATLPKNAARAITPAIGDRKSVV